MCDSLIAGQVYLNVSRLVEGPWYVPDHVSGAAQLVGLA